ncbi:UNKNOWN [Stylonychia lemnae]|uniref:Uncharacterized protein n=1 Tax=Stylonychia lemnae TaxID=5949 RepID=A0A078ARN5_STYLE|nr:UNKNOWN [Stylonychia lemnae]|eukprot:CDW84641.1 UNKNOWN [Stylonychia lemnae]
MENIYQFHNNHYLRQLQCRDQIERKVYIPLFIEINEQKSEIKELRSKNVDLAHLEVQQNVQFSSSSKYKEMKTQIDNLYKENRELMKQNQELTSLYLKDHNQVKQLEERIRLKADRLAALQEEVQETKEEKELMLQKIEYFKALVEQKDQDLKNMENFKNSVESKLIDQEIEYAKKKLPPKSSNLIDDYDFFDHARDFTVASFNFVPKSQNDFQQNIKEDRSVKLTMNKVSSQKNLANVNSFKQYNADSKTKPSKRPTHTSDISTQDQSADNTQSYLKRQLKTMAYVGNQPSWSGVGLLNQMDEIKEEDSMVEQSMIVHSHNSTQILQPNLFHSRTSIMTKGKSGLYGAYHDIIPSKPVQCIQAHNTDGICVAFNKNGEGIATGGDQALKLWDTNSLGLQSSFSRFSKSVNCLTYSNNSDYLMVCSNDYQAKILKSNPLRVLTFLNGHTDIINQCCFSNFTQKAVTGSADRQIKIWDIYKGQSSEKFVSSSQCNSIDISYSDRVILSGHQDGGLRIWHTQQKTPAKEISDLHDEAIVSAIFLPDGNQILTSSKDNSLKILDSRTFEVVQTISDNMNYTCSYKGSKLVLSPTGNQVIVPSASGRLVAFDLTNGNFLKTLKNDKLHGASELSISISSLNSPGNTSIVDVDWCHKTNRLASIDRGGFLTLWN